MAEKKILIYQSNQNQKYLDQDEAMLVARGYEVKSFFDGESAMAEAEKTPPDLFITSMGLKGNLDGLQYTRALKTHDKLKEIPIILLTAARRVMHLPFNFVPDPVNFPVFDVVEKPVRPGYLYEVIDKALASRPGGKS
ncbi:MAG: response regulator [Candidatus Sumerlaeota bacterium]|nr:response regulator [Candidatus Sumerlaeota bacterium]